MYHFSHLYYKMVFKDVEFLHDNVIYRIVGKTHKVHLENELRSFGTQP